MRDSVAIAVRLSRKQTDLNVTSPNSYATLDSHSEHSDILVTPCTKDTPSNIRPSLTKPVYAKLAPWAKEHARLHWSFCERERCSWHHDGDMFDENEYLEKDKKENPRVKELNKRSDRSPSPELLSAGEERRNRALTPERSGIRSLKCETAKSLERSDQSPSIQKNRNKQNTGKDDLEVRKLRNPETWHSLQRRGA